MTHYYSGDLSRDFWARVNRCDNMTLYLLGCALQDVETRMLQALEDAEKVVQGSAEPPRPLEERAAEKSKVSDAAAEKPPQNDGARAKSAPPPPAVPSDNPLSGLGSVVGDALGASPQFPAPTTDPPSVQSDPIPARQPLVGDNLCDWCEGRGHRTTIGEDDIGVTARCAYCNGSGLRPAASAPERPTRETPNENHCDEWAHNWGVVIGEAGKPGQRCNCGKEVWPESREVTELRAALAAKDKELREVRHDLDVEDRLEREARAQLASIERDTLARARAAVESVDVEGQTDLGEDPVDGFYAGRAAALRALDALAASASDHREPQ